MGRPVNGHGASFHVTPASFRQRIVSSVVVPPRSDPELDAWSALFAILATIGAPAPILFIDAHARPITVGLPEAAFAADRTAAYFAAYPRHWLHLAKLRAGIGKARGRQ